MGNHGRFQYNLLLLVLCCSLFLLAYIVTANPLPVYPNPEMEFSPTNDVSYPPLSWILIVFCVDVCLDILLVYGGLFILDKSHLLEEGNVLDFSKTHFISAVMVISIIGLVSEILFGMWLGGLILALLCIWLSFIVVSVYLLRLSWMNGIRIGLFAVIINIVVWILVFSV